LTATETSFSFASRLPRPHRLMTCARRSPASRLSRSAAQRSFSVVPRPRDVRGPRCLRSNPQHQVGPQWCIDAACSRHSRDATAMSSTPRKQARGKNRSGCRRSVHIPGTPHAPALHNRQRAWARHGEREWRGARADRPRQRHMSPPPTHRTGRASPVRLAASAALASSRHRLSTERSLPVLQFGMKRGHLAPDEFAQLLLGDVALLEPEREVLLL